MFREEIVKLLVALTKTYRQAKGILNGVILGK